MSTLSQHLGLILNDPSDPFKRTDFTTNLTKLDQFPGVYVCTSITRPSWTAAQAGMAIYETDSRRTLHWSGTAWRAGTDLPMCWTGQISPGVSMSSGATVTYTLGTLTVLSPATLYVNMVAEGRQNRGPHIGTSAFGLTVQPLIDNANASASTAGYYEQWTETGATGSFNDYRQIPAQGIKSVGVGSHQVGIKVTASLGANGGAFMGASFVALLVNSTDVS